MKQKLDVVRGKGRGKQIGIPTINCRIPEQFDFDEGVYAGWVVVKNKKYPSAVHFGPRPTFSEQDNSLEIYILGDFSQEVPLTVELELVYYIREIRSFVSVDEMKKEIEQDIAKIKRLLRIEE